MLNGLSPRRSPYLTERRPASPSTDTTPFDTVRLPICTPSRAEAMSSSAWRASAAAARRRGRSGTLQCAEIEAEDERAAALDEIAARERGLGEEVGHRVPPAILVDASSMAFMTRG